MRIRAKLSLFTGLVIFATAGALATLAFFLQKDLIEKHFAESRSAQVMSFATICSQSLAINNDLLLINYVKLLQSAPGVDYAYFVDDQSQIRIHSDRRFLYKPVSDWAASKPVGSDEETAVVRLGSHPAGSAVIGFSKIYQKQALESALRRTLSRVTAAAAAVAAAALLAALLFSFLLTGPLKALADGSERVAAGDFKTQVPVTSGDEVGELARRFNSMAKSLSVLDELKDHFISSVTHDLRNPLAAIQMSADFMLNDDADRAKLLPHQRETFRMIVDNSTRLGVYVTNVLDLAKIKAGRMEYHPQAVSLEKIAGNVGSLFSAMAGKRGVALISDIPLNMPPLWADPERLDQALANLVSNALKFTPSGGRITLGARVGPAAAEIYVADTGQGIPKEDISRLFKQFNQAGMPERDGRQGVKGTGLGLFIVKQTAEALGGRINVESEVGKGTRFILTLSLASAKQPG